MGLEHRINLINNFEDKFKSGFFSKVKSSLTGKIAAYGLAAGLALGGVGLYGCGGGNGGGGPDNVAQNTYYRDFDTDTFGNPLDTILAYSLPIGYVTNNTDCNDNNNTVYPYAPEICDLIDNQCPGNPGYGTIDEGVTNSYFRDFDGDTYGNPISGIQACSAPIGYVSNNLDCIDSNPNVNPSQTEIVYNTLNDDCNSATRDDDLDIDGFYVLTGSVDCNDAKNTVYPNAPELCDGIDNQCPGNLGYGIIDEGCGPICTNLDGDGFSIEGGLCGLVDCNDNDKDIYPGAPSPEYPLLCDGKDNQCPGNPGYGAIDEGCIVNTPPTVSLTYPGNGIVTTDDTPRFMWFGNDLDGDPLTYTFYIRQNNPDVWPSGMPVGSSTQYTSGPHSPNIFYWGVEVSDGTDVVRSSVRNIDIRSGVYYSTTPIDTWIDQVNPSSNHCNDTTLKVSGVPSKNARAYVKFNMPNVELGATVNNGAQLSLRILSDSGGNISGHLVTNTGGKNSCSVNWNTAYFYDDLPTSGAGTRSGGRMYFNVQNLVQRMLDGLTNEGFALIPESSSSNVTFYSVDSSSDPILEFSWIINDPL